MRTHRLLFTLSMSLFLMLLGACSDGESQATPQATPSIQETEEAAPTLQPTLPPTATVPFSDDGPWEINFTTVDDATLYGILYGQGDVGVILAPSYPNGAEGWAPFAEEIAAQGYRVLTFDFRGQGQSKGERSFADAPADLDAAIAVVRENVAERVVLIGAGLGGMASIRAASQNEGVLGLVVISSPRMIEDFEISDQDLSGLKVPSLWLGTRNDMLHNIEDMYEAAGRADKQFWIYEGSSLHGTYILEGADAPDLKQRLLEFIDQVAQ
ncbi:MAG: alpha/beta hydrolase [Anaerolineae bacterium]|nr:alpha/beta hydrolase [Anaerolineae bacterium]